MKEHKEHVISNELCLIESYLSVVKGIPETVYLDFRSLNEDEHSSGENDNINPGTAVQILTGWITALKESWRMPGFLCVLGPVLSYTVINGLDRTKMFRLHTAVKKANGLENRIRYQKDLHWLKGQAKTNQMIFNRDQPKA